MQKNIFVSFHHYIFMRMGMDTCQYFLKFSISVLRSTKYLTNLLKRADHGEIFFWWIVFNSVLQRFWWSRCGVHTWNCCYKQVHFALSYFGRCKFFWYWMIKYLGITKNFTVFNTIDYSDLESLSLFLHYETRKFNRALLKWPKLVFVNHFYD